jgi:lipid II:glycine glycyltransferase (peptidoglycan interpeptide bridge formation enzyme)
MTKYVCKFITNEEKDTWENIVKNSSISGFQQSFNWANIKKQTNNVCHRIGLYCDEKLIGGGLVYEYKVKNWKVLHCPEGPIIDYTNINQMAEILKVIKSISAKDPIITTFKIEPRLKEFPKELSKIFRKSNNHHLPNNTIVIDLTQPFEEIENEMKSKFKYNVRLAKKKGLIANHYINPNKNIINEFYEIYKLTAKRNNFKLKSIKIFELIAKEMEENCIITTISLEDKAVSAAFNIGYGNRLTYYFGASDNNYRNYMPNNLLQFSIIEWAKSNKYKAYDLWGISPKNSNNHEWSGFTKFKKQIQQKELNLVGAHDLALNSEYDEYLKYYRQLGS